MSQEKSFGSGYGYSLIASARLAGFFLLILGMLPIHFYYAVWRRHDRYSVPLKFHGLLLKLLGFRVRTYGAMATTAPVLFVANHASYLDIPVLGALVPAAFVAKAEVASWPLIGYLAKLQNTIFIERRAGRVSDQRDHLRDHLAEGKSILLFPEGTSSDGLSVLPFKSSLFSIVEEAVSEIAITVQPISITCTQLDGLPITRACRPYYAWFGDMTLVGHLWNVFKFGHFTIDVVFHAPAPAALGSDRKALALYCQQQVARGIEQCLTGRDRPGEPDPARLPSPV